MENGHYAEIVVILELLAIKFYYAVLSLFSTDFAIQCLCTV